MRILVTGSRNWNDKFLIKSELINHTSNSSSVVTIVHGAAPGADSIAGFYARELGFIEERHPASWSEFGRSAGYIRNKAMVDLGADICLAFIRNNSKGASMCASLAEKSGIPVKYWRKP